MKRKSLRAIFCVVTMFSLILIAATGRAQSLAKGNGIIQGTVSNAADGLPLRTAKVIIKGNPQEALADEYGRFVLSGITEGEYQLEVSYLGFDSQSSTAVVQAGRTSVLNFQLALQGSGATGAAAGIIGLERFTVVSDRVMSAQALAMNEQRHAANIKNVVAFEELGEQGMENIGNYVRFMPGVVIMDDGTNASSLGLGGFPDSMSTVQVDGGDVASTGTGTESSRRMSLQDVPMVNVERIEITKVPTPDMPASGLGGSMNIITKSLLGMRSPLFTYQMYMNFNNRDGISFDGGPRQATSATSPANMEPSYNATYSFPVRKRLAFSLGASRTWNRRPTDNTPAESANWNLVTQEPGSTVRKDLVLIEALWSQKADVGTTENLQASMEAKLSDRDTLAFGIQRRDTVNRTAEYGYVARFGTGTGDATYVDSARTGTTRFDLTSRNNIIVSSETIHGTMQYKHLGPQWRIEGRGVYSKAKKIRDGLNNGYFEALGALSPNHNIRGEGINQGESILPSTYISTGRDGRPMAFNLYDANDYNLGTAKLAYGNYNTDLTAGRLDLERKFGNHLSVKMGGAYNRLEKDDRRSDLNYTFVGDSRGTAISAYDLLDESIDVKMNGVPVRWLSPIKAYQLFVEKPGTFTLNPSAVQQEAQNSKRMIEAVSAGFLRFDLRLLQNRLHVASGVRYENTRLDGWSMKRDDSAIYQRDANGNFIRNAAGALVLIPGDATSRNRLIYQERAHREDQSYGGLYPSINANYSLTENLVLRAAYARTIGRPDVSYVVAGIILPNPSAANLDVARTIIVGNPGLEPWTADSFHLSIDSYNRNKGYGSLGVYRKYVNNFFKPRILPVDEETLEYYSIPAEEREFMISRDYQMRRWENVGDAHLTGFELSYRHDLPFLPAWLEKMQAWVNYTHLAVGGSNTEEFVGFTPDVLSVGLNYIRPRFALRLNGAYQGETKVSLDYNPDTSARLRYPPETYTYLGDYTKYGMTAEYAVSKRFVLFTNWDNVFAKDRYYYRRGPDTPDNIAKSRRYVNPSTIMMGVKGRF